MMDRLTSHPDLRPWLAMNGITDCRSLLRHLESGQTRLITDPDAPTHLWIERIAPEDGRVPFEIYIKCYRYRRPSLKFSLRRSKARQEFHNAEIFRQLGIPTPDPLAWGEVRDGLRRLHRAIIITRAVPDAQPLSDVTDRVPTLPRPARMRIIRTLASMAASLHRAGRIHHDLHWRNVLLQLDDDTHEPAVWWIDCPRGRPVLPLICRRSMVRDLACLARTAVTICTAADRMRFLDAYLGSGSTRATRRWWWTAIERCRRAKWPMDDVR